MRARLVEVIADRERRAQTGIGTDRGASLSAERY